MVSPLLASRLAPGVVALELVGGTFLVLGFFKWVGGLLIASLLLVFVLSLCVNLARGRRDLDCRCFGRPTAGIGWGHVIEDLVLLAVALLVAGSAWRDGTEGSQT